MKNVLCLNKIAAIGTDLLDKNVYNVGTEVANPDAIMVRSAAMHEMEFGAELKAIARAGAGVNNIPVDRCAKEGIVVFNTPGANANGVKELAVCALMLASRDIAGAMKWAETLAGTEGVAKAVEAGKSKFAGVEVKGKTLGTTHLLYGGVGHDCHGAHGTYSSDAVVGNDVRVAQVGHNGSGEQGYIGLTLHVVLRTIGWGCQQKVGT